MTRLGLLLTVMAVCELYPAAGSDFLDDAVLEAMTLTLYPGYLKTAEEAIEINYQNRKLMSESCDGDTNVVNHACCQSESSLNSPSWLWDNRQKQNRKIVRFHSRRQYFPTETCKQVTNCEPCRCAMVNQTFTALVENPNYPKSSPFRVSLWLVQAPTFCRCFNNLLRVQTTSEGENDGKVEIEITDKDDVSDDDLSTAAQNYQNDEL